MKINILRNLKGSMKSRDNRGFTVLESLIAIAILLIAITGPLVVISQSLKASYHSRDEITAFYLAQEAIEHARWQRDNNALSASASALDWLIGFPINCLNDANENVDSVKKCYLKRPNNPSLYDPYQYYLCGANGCPVLARDSNEGGDGIYGSDSLTAEDTIFTREIYFTKVPTGDCGGGPEGCTTREIIMTVRILWDNNVGSSEFILNERLYNWKAAQSI